MYILVLQFYTDIISYMNLYCSNAVYGIFLCNKVIIIIVLNASSQKSSFKYKLEQFIAQSQKMTSVPFLTLNIRISWYIKYRDNINVFISHLLAVLFVFVTSYITLHGVYQFAVRLSINTDHWTISVSFKRWTELNHQTVLSVTCGCPNGLSIVNCILYLVCWVNNKEQLMHT